MVLERVVGPGHAESKRLLVLRSLNFILRAGESFWRVLREREGCSKPCWIPCRAEVGGTPDEMRDQYRQGQPGCRRELGDV